MDSTSFSITVSICIFPQNVEFGRNLRFLNLISRFAFTINGHLGRICKKLCKTVGVFWCIQMFFVGK